MNAISTHYSCPVSLKKKISTIDGEGLNYQLDLKEQDMNQFHKSPTMAARFSSWLFLNALGEKSRHVSNLRISYHFNAELVEVETDLEAIRLACSMNPRLSEIDSALKTRQYDQFLSMVDPNMLKETSKEKLQSSLVELDSQYGKVEELIITGLEFVPPLSDPNKTYIRFLGSVNRGGTYYPISVVFNPFDAFTPIVAFLIK